MLQERGNLRIDEVSFQDLSAGANALQWVTTDGSTRTVGLPLTWDANGNAVAAAEWLGQPLNWRGAWSSSTAYNPSDTVTYNGSTYFALQANTNEEPDTATAYWGVLAKLNIIAGTNITTSTDGSGDVTINATLPTATNSVLGVVKPDGSTITINGSGVISAAGLSGSESANTVLAGPSSGSSSTPGFRSLVAADIPNLPESQITNLTSDLAATEKTANKGAANGYAPLNSSSEVPVANLPPMGASGTSHSAGLVPDPGSTSGNIHYLREDGTWQVPPGATASILTTKGDLLGYDTAADRIPVGADGTTLTADSTQALGVRWGVRSAKFGWTITNGATASNAGGYLPALFGGQITTAYITINASDPGTNLTFDILHNSASIFTAPQSVTAGTSSGTITSLTSSLAANPTSVSAGDKFQINITSGTGTWQFTVAVG